MNIESTPLAATELDRIRDKPMMELTADEIEQLTLQEQSWIWGYRASVRAAKRPNAER